MAGWFDSGSPDYTWDASSTDPGLKANWQDFWGSNFREDHSLSLDMNGLLNQILTDAGIVLAVAGLLLTGHTTDGQGAHPGGGGNPPPGGQAAARSVGSPQGTVAIADTGLNGPIPAVVGATEQPLVVTEPLLHRDFVAQSVEPFYDIDSLGRGLITCITGQQK
jgi:hypothetical protein